jgi:quercetin dioxygenase-like cupin family protein
MLRYSLEGEGFECFQWVDRPGVYYGLHKHPEAQSHWIVSGKIEIHVKDGGTFQLGPGDRDFMPAETYHSARVIGDEPVVYLIGIKKPAPLKAAVRKPKRKAVTKRPTAKPSKPTAKKPKRKSAAKPKSAARPSAKPPKATAGKAKRKPASKTKSTAKPTTRRAKTAATTPKTKTLDQEKECRNKTKVRKVNKKI